MGLAIGVDVGGTKLAAGVVDDSGLVLEQQRVRTPKNDPEGLRGAIIVLLQDLKSRHDITAVGIGAAGFINAERNGVYFSAHVDWGNAPVTDALQEEVGLPVSIENDGNAAAWAEHAFGAGRGVPDQLMVALGTGIGGGMILGGELYRGGHGVAAEIGHLNLVPGGRSCECGREGCFEEYASGNALQRMGQEAAADGSAPTLLAMADGDPAAVSGEHVTELVRTGHEEGVRLFEQLAEPLGNGIATLVAVLDPTLVVLGGGVSAAGEFLLAPTRPAVERQLSGRGHREPPELRIAVLGNDAGMIGAADLARRALG
jgi:glucokinase